MNQESELFSEIKRLATEQRNPASAEIDTASVGEILRIINSEDHLVAESVAKEIPYIEAAVELIVDSFNNDGRLFYAGAGTSGRLGILDASECPPTFGSEPDRVQGLIAGGRDAVFRSQEGAEDLEENGVQAIKDASVSSNDVVCGIAASRRTPYVVGAVNYARSLGCKTLFITCTPRSEFPLEVDVAICPVPGPEVIMGSTRMKSGTAQKLVLNMLTTATFIRMGKVYENMMVDLQMTNLKLVERSKRTVMTVTGASYVEAGKLLDSAEGHVKTAIVMNLASVNLQEAKARLERTGGFVRPAIDGKYFSPS
ncbi:MAG: N-acetylmuramic acid 6-phosphate etherase [Bacteroidetes bacterium]|nr:MAG: N-acetylmuramic acid 6-phosphate etherase [Bacteroidota bacterium]